MTNTRERQVIGGITALALIGRLQAIFQPMRYDESVSWAYYIGRSWGTIAGTYKQPNNHVFFSLLSRLASAWVDYAPWALRLPAFLAGILIIPLIWLVGRRFADPRTGLLGAAFAAGAPALVLYATNARGYSFIVAFFLALLLVADRLCVASSRALWISYAIMGALGLYTIPVMLYPLGVVATWLALDLRRRDGADRRRRLIALALANISALGIAAVLYAPIIWSSGVSALTENKFVTASSWESFVIALPSMFLSTYASWTTPLPAWAALLVLLVALAGIRWPVSRQPPVLAAVVLWCGALLIAMHRVPYDRVWLFILPLFLLAVARGVFVIGERLSARPIPAALLASASALIIVSAEMSVHAAERNDDTGTFPDAEQVTRILAPRLRTTDRVLAPIPAIGPLLYYFPRANADTALLTVPLERVKRVFLVLDASRHQDLAWAVEHELIDPRYFSEPALVARLREAVIWETHLRE